MNKKLNPGSMVSSRGYAIRRLDRAELEYQTGDKIMKIAVEPGYQKNFMIKFPVVVYLSSMRAWNTPNGNENIGEAEQLTIKKNIREGLRFLGVRCVFE